MKIGIPIVLVISVIVLFVGWNFYEVPVVLSPVETMREEITESKNDAAIKDDVPTENNASNALTLDLRNKNLTKAPSSLFEQSELETINLSHNALSGSLQGEIRLLQNLKTLDLSYNNFTGVPAEVGQLKNLESLNLAHNQLTGLPHELGNLSNLKVLNVSGNNYSEADLAIITEKLPKTTVIIIK